VTVFRQGKWKPMRICYRTENMSELSCDGIPPGKMEADAQWYPFVMV
jgi:hypothetical protein